MRAVFMGTPEIAAVILESIIETGLSIEAVITQPDRPKGRGGEMAFPEVKITALKHDLKVMQPVKVRRKEFIDEIRNINPDIIIVAAFGQILPKALLEIPKYGSICVHASLLPRYRGAAPIQWAVINGEKETGITIIYMDEGIDTGDMILQKRINIDEKETAGSLHDKLAVLGAAALCEAMAKIESGTAERIPQDNELSNYASMLKKSDGLIDFKKPADVLERLVRGLNPWPSAYTCYNGRMIKMWDTEALMDYCMPENNDFEDGAIIECSKEYIYIKTGTGVLKICELQPEGKKKMSCKEFLRGYQVKEGDYFGR